MSLNHRRSLIEGTPSCSAGGKELQDLDYQLRPQNKIHEKENNSEC